MNYLILLFSTATIVAGIIIVISPEMVFGLLRRRLQSVSLHIIAVVVRIILGIALIVCSTGSKYPTVLLIIGWVSIIAATVLGVMGRANFMRLMSWALSFSNSFGPIGGFLAIIFGWFLIHAVI